MSQTLDQIFISNPITSNASTDLMYFSQSPYTAGKDAGMTYANFSAQFVNISNLGLGVETALGASVIAAGGIALSSATTTFSPVISFTTPGDLSVSYEVQFGSYARVGNIVMYSFQLTFTPTFTTASGILTISMPINANQSFSKAYGSISFGGITLSVGYTDLALATGTAGLLNVWQSGTTQARVTLTATQLTSGGTYTINGTIGYTI